jgi:signal transduction histidine kinase
MSNHSDNTPDWDAMRVKIIGLGESSIRKSYYPELQKRMLELQRSNDSLSNALKEIQCKEEELHNNLDKLNSVQSLLVMSRKKLALLNTLTFQDIQNSLFSLHGYLTLIDESTADTQNLLFIKKSLEQVRKIERFLEMAKHYQEMGINPPKWHKLNEIFIYAISHLNFSNLKRDMRVDGVCIFADPMFETALYFILENILVHSVNASKYKIYVDKYQSGILLIIEDNGIGIEDKRKEAIFKRDYNNMTGIGLFLVREILSITDITISENGNFGKGARFELMIPEGRYKISDF